VDYPGFFAKFRVSDPVDFRCSGASFNEGHGGALAVMVFSLPRLKASFSIVTKEGFPTLPFQQWWQSVVEKIEAQEETQDTLITDLAAAVADIATAQAAADAAQADATAVAGDLSNYVLRNQSSAWAAPTGTLLRTTFAAASAAANAAYVQADFQAALDRIEALEKRAAALITDLKADVLT
jgi:hypothetical protein